ncbi:hypothetical protein D3C85_1108900 [compost metagenome]
MAAAQGIGQRLFVDQATTGSIDHESPGFEQAQLRGADHVPGVFVERAMQGQGIDLRQQLVQRQAVFALRAPGQLPQQHTHAQGFGQPPDGAAQFAMAEQAEGLALQFDDGEIQQAELAGALPVALGHGLLIIGQAGGQGQQQGQGMLGNRWGTVALAIADADTLGTRGVQVDIVGAGGGHQDQLEVRAGRQGFAIEHHFVADHGAGALQALTHLLRCSAGVQLQFIETAAQFAEVEITQVQRGVIEEDGATIVTHQLYLLCRWVKG